MIQLDKLFQKHAFKFFSYSKQLQLVKLTNRNDNSSDHIVFDELKIIVDELMKLPVDFHILDNGDIEIEKI